MSQQVINIGAAEDDNTGDHNRVAWNKTNQNFTELYAVTYQPLDADLTAIAALAGTNTIYYRSGTDTWSPVVVSTGLAFSGGNLTATSAGGNVSNSGTPTAGQIAQWTDATHVQGISAATFLKKNYIINGAMRISQENGTTVLPLTTSVVYPVDTFFTNATTSGSLTAAQVASLTPGGSPNRLRFTVTAVDTLVGAGELIQILHSIEGFNVADLKIGTAAAKQVTLQFSVKGPAGTYGVSLMNDSASRIYASEYTISAGEANTDVVKSITLTLDTTGTWLKDNGVGLNIRFFLMAGSSFHTPSLNVWPGNNYCTINQSNFMATNGNVFELFDVGLYEGTVAPTFQVPDYASELGSCQRYYCRVVNQDGANYRWCGGAGATPIDGGLIPFPCTMRATPTIVTVSAPVYANCSLAGLSANVDSAVLSLVGTAIGFYVASGGTYGFNARL